jgi:hypothetical protein
VALFVSTWSFELSEFDHRFYLCFIRPTHWTLYPPFLNRDVELS